MVEAPPTRSLWQPAPAQCGEKGVAEGGGAGWSGGVAGVGLVVRVDPAKEEEEGVTKGASLRGPCQFPQPEGEKQRWGLSKLATVEGCVSLGHRNSGHPGLVCAS